jgi:hypothetical protein
VLSSFASVLQAFGRGLQVPKRIYTIDELRLNKVEPEKLLSPTGGLLPLLLLVLLTYW